MLRKTKQPIIQDSHPGLPLDPDAVQPGVYKSPHLTPGLQITVFLGGCIGTLARYGIITKIPTQNSWPRATFIANLLGAFALGFLLEALLRRGEDRGSLQLIRLGIGTGFIGAFTTYSSLAVEINLLFTHSQLNTAAAYALISVVGGIVTSAFGIQAAASHHRIQTGNKS